MTAVHPDEVDRLSEGFDPFRDPHLADPYPFFEEARRATPVFFSPRINYWVVARYHDVRQIFATPAVFSASNGLSLLQPARPAADKTLDQGGFRPVLGNAFLRLLTHRSNWEQIRRDPALIPNAIEEVLRIDSSVIAWRRRTTQAVEIGGVAVPRDANLLLLIGSANRDSAVFADLERFDIHRSNANQNLAFGHGPHFCLGAPLARLEARVVLEEFSARFPDLNLVAGQKLSFQPNISFRGPCSLLAEWSV